VCTPVKLTQLHHSHPLPILNVSEHLTRLKLQTGNSNPFSERYVHNIREYRPNLTTTLLAITSKFLQVIGALLGTQNGRDVEIVNSFDIATTAGPGRDLGLGEAVGIEIDQGFLAARKEQCAPSWSFQPRARHPT
jgi:COP9 signalosome complex subunit 6